MIIGLIGEIGVGKTTIAHHLKTKNFEEYSFASPIKKIAEIFGFEHYQIYGTQQQRLEINEKWGISCRTFLQKFGTEIGREVFPHVFPEMNIRRGVWLDLFMHQYDTSKNYVVSDVRFENEAQLIRDLHGILIRIRRTSEKGFESQHTSEQEINLIRYNFEINHDVVSKEEAKQMIDGIVRTVV